MEGQRLKMEENNNVNIDESKQQKFLVCYGEYTQEENEYLIKAGLATENSEGELSQVSTLTASDLGEENVFDDDELFYESNVAELEDQHQFIESSNLNRNDCGEQNVFDDDEFYESNVAELEDQHQFIESSDLNRNDLGKENVFDEIEFYESKVAELEDKHQLIESSNSSNLNLNRKDFGEENVFDDDKFYESNFITELENQHQRIESNNLTGTGNDSGNDLVNSTNGNVSTLAEVEEIHALDNLNEEKEKMETDEFEDSFNVSAKRRDSGNASIVQNAGIPKQFLPARPTFGIHDNENSPSSF